MGVDLNRSSEYGHWEKVVAKHEARNVEAAKEVEASLARGARVVTEGVEACRTARRRAAEERSR